MCGLVGVLDNGGVRPDVLATMTRALTHRGPDDEGFVFLQPDAKAFIGWPSNGEVADRYPAAMGFRRLSILDLSEHGRQPMISSSGRFAMMLNGEIYNYRELRASLINEGICFQSQSDTEVALVLYEREGPAMLSKLNGMFAIAVLDAQTGAVWLARDRLGIKPLYYYVRGRVVLYASEIKAFLCHPSFTRALNVDRLSEYLLFRYVAEPESLWAGVRAVEPGTHMTIQDGQIRTIRYWQIPSYAPLSRGPAENEVALESLMRSSIRYQLISDVKVGCQLSGGIDSSLISAWAVREHPGLFDAISVIFREATYSEEPQIDMVTTALGLVGHKTVLDAACSAEMFEDATWHHDLPLNHPNSLGILRLSGLARSYVTVLLSGEGADEVFGGYQRFATAARLIQLGRYPGGTAIWRRLRPRLAPFRDHDGMLIGLSAFGDPEQVSRLYPAFSMPKALETRRALWESASESDPLERLITYEQRTFLVDALMRQDRMSMARSIENRVPFLDHRVVEFAKTLPTRLKIDSGAALTGWTRLGTKVILKRLAARRFGSALAYRAKSGFGLPLQEWFASGAFRGVMEPAWDVLRASGLFDHAELDRLLTDHSDVSESRTRLRWIMTALGVWMRTMLYQPMAQMETSRIGLAETVRR
jgi:asparagine synthase (glutamine-hydrolysing)